jgi:hypothetical protein
MPPSAIGCTLILIHGLGDQAADWSAAFRAAFTPALGADAARVNVVDAYWAKLSTRDDLLHPRLGVGAVPASGLGLDDEAYNRAVLEFTRALGRSAGAPRGERALSPGEIFDVIKGRLPGGEELLVDAGNYVGRNGVRTAVQNVLHAALAAAHQDAPDVPVVLVSHSQGTIIAYDVLRQAGEAYPRLRTWITMGSPLGKYLGFPFEWGALQLGVPPDLRWVNLFDPQDIVGVELNGMVDWPRPQPIDVAVDNVGHAHDAHDHWHNPEVVAHIKDEVLRVLNG